MVEEVLMDHRVLTVTYYGGGGGDLFLQLP